MQERRYLPLLCESFVECGRTAGDVKVDQREIEMDVVSVVSEYVTGEFTGIEEEKEWKKCDEEYLISQQEHEESAMAVRETMMQVLCTSLQVQVTGSTYSELHQARPSQLKSVEELDFYMRE
ncbi:hypothetical protein NDU88_005903 [Pleurodeles waltl]|uniref:Uncharacterized protein n=1 Tax=Pleurodeles waltl TaxID=8319 RepID=A0AAV7WE15_PLEWA|nr:hypothetical protein NDU88_005903 [Pleurodeles waltl]